MLLQDRSPAEILDWAVRFEEAGVDSLWVPDHLANPSDLNSFWLDAWTVLAAIAERTSRCRIGILVSNFVLHPPLQMARLTVTLDAVSGGRLELGLGLGNAPVCRSAASVWDDGPALADRLEQGISSLVQILGDVPLALPRVPAVAGYDGPESVRLSTPCRQVPRPPIIVGGHGPRVLDIAARFADRWNVYYPPGADTDGLDVALTRLTERFEERCAVHGRSGQVRRSILFDYAPALQPSGRQELTELMLRVSQLGFDEFIVTSWPVRGDDRRANELLEFIGEDLLTLRTT
jgi:alkanesulfonate monooxygenase SsuD/methylene tetrahydromethanopterin reductase-like flavin-dependent oxidoreductase (luciferase family)